MLLLAMARMKRPIIALLSDFGLKDPYVAEMKAVILSICPEARIIDITHQIEKFNIRMGAFILASASQYFPKGTIHVAVVDPGVGTARRAIIVETSNSLFVGPDNGLLLMAAEKQGIKHVYEIRNRRYMLPRVSRTFHGRDIFAPAAAYLANGVSPKKFGPEIKDYIVPEYAKPIIKRGKIMGEILHIDDFGNLITNIPEEFLSEMGMAEGDSVRVTFGDKSFEFKICRAYGEVNKGKPLAIIGSHNFLEFSVNLGSAAEYFGLKVGNKFRLEKI